MYVSDEEDEATVEFFTEAAEFLKKKVVAFSAEDAAAALAPDTD